MVKPSQQWIGFLAFGMIYFVWGANFVAIRFAIESIPPFLMAGTRFFAAGMVLYLFMRARGEKLPSFSSAIPAVKQGILLNVLGTGGLVWSEQYIPSGLAAIVFATVPLWMVLLEKEKWGQNFTNPFIVSGLGIGIVGVAFLSDYDTLGYLSDNRELFYSGLIVLLASTICWSWGSLFSKKMNRNISLPMNLSVQMATAGMFLYLAGFLFGEHSSFSISGVTRESVSALLFLIIFSSILGYLAYLWLLKKYSPALVGTYAYVHPVVAIFLGWGFADEPIGVKTLLSLAIILMAVYLIKFAHSQTQSITTKQKNYDSKNLARGCPEGKS